MELTAGRPNGAGGKGTGIRVVVDFDGAAAQLYVRTRECTRTGKEIFHNGHPADIQHH